MTNKYMATLGGGLGDVFVKLYHCSQYQILQMISDKIDIDCRVTCCNPSSKSVIESMGVFKDIIYKDMFFPNTDEGKEWVTEYRDRGYLFIDEGIGWKTLFNFAGVDNPFQYGYFHGTLYHHKYHLTDEEQLLFESLPKPYIVIHPSGGLQNVDGLDRIEYAWLMKLLIDEFPKYNFITIGATHVRSDSVHSKNGIPAVIVETPFNIQHNRFIDLTNKTSGALCANIVENAVALIGSHSAWMNMFWNFNKPTICILSNKTPWGDGENYIKTNGCNWGFKLPQTSVVIFKVLIDDVYNKVIEELEVKLNV